MAPSYACQAVWGRSGEKVVLVPHDGSLEQDE
jgi:hypothetical protein